MSGSEVLRIKVTVNEAELEDIGWLKVNYPGLDLVLVSDQDDLGNVWRVERQPAKTAEKEGSKEA